MHNAGVTQPLPVNPHFNQPETTGDTAAVNAPPAVDEETTYEESQPMDTTPSNAPGGETRPDEGTGDGGASEQIEEARDRGSEGPAEVVYGGRTAKGEGEGDEEGSVGISNRT